jgi:hypothetical protein
MLRLSKHSEPFSATCYCQIFLVLFMFRSFQRVSSTAATKINE